MIKEFTDSIKASIYEKSVSPLFGAYAGIWLVCNWKLVSYFSLSNKPIVEKIEYIECNYIDSWHNFYLPLIITFIFLIVYPILSIGAYYIWERASTIKANLRFSLGSKVPLSIEESIQIRKDARSKEEQFKNEIDEYKQRLNHQKEIEAELRTKIQEVKSKPIPEENIETPATNENNHFTNVSDPHITVKECDEYVLNFIKEMKQNDKASFREMIPVEVWEEIPRRSWKNINNIFLSLVKDGAFPEIKHAGNKEHNEPVYMRL